MFLWVACDIAEAFAEIRSICREQNRAVGLSEAALSLPPHISLKISFPIAESELETAVERLTALLQTRSSFSVKTIGLEQVGETLWVAFEPTAALTALHAELDTLVESEFGVSPHPFDREFCFHSTLFQDADTTKLAQMAARLTALPLPPDVTVSHFFIGCSPSGRAGEYTVCKRI